MEFPKDDLSELIYGDFDGYKLIDTSVIDVSRWSIMSLMIFSHDGVVYGCPYSRGATEAQDEAPFEYAPDMIECDEYEEVMSPSWVKKS